MDPFTNQQMNNPMIVEFRYQNNMYIVVCDADNVSRKIKSQPGVSDVTTREYTELKDLLTLSKIQNLSNTNLDLSLVDLIQQHKLAPLANGNNIGHNTLPSLSFSQAPRPVTTAYAGVRPQMQGDIVQMLHDALMIHIKRQSNDRTIANIKMQHAIKIPLDSEEKDRLLRLVNNTLNSSHLGSIEPKEYTVSGERRLVMEYTPATWVRPANFVPERIHEFCKDTFTSLFADPAIPKDREAFPIPNPDLPKKANGAPDEIELENLRRNIEGYFNTKLATFKKPGVCKVTLETDAVRGVLQHYVVVNYDANKVTLRPNYPTRW